MEPRVSNPLLDYLIARYKLKNDRELAQWLGLQKPDISRIRNKKRAISAEVILRVHDLTELPVSEIKRIIRGEK